MDRQGFRAPDADATASQGRQPLWSVGRSSGRGVWVVLAAVFGLLGRTDGFAGIGGVAPLRLPRGHSSCLLREHGAPGRMWKAAGMGRVGGLAMSSSEKAAKGGDKAWQRPPPRGKRDVVFGARINTAVPVSSEQDEGYTLGKYMMLPPEQYVLIPLPNKAKLDRINSGNFRLRVPELQFLNVWVRPMCEASVDVTDNGVIIDVTRCHLEGSPEVERLGINKRYELQMRVVLSAREDARGLKGVMVGRSELSVWVDPPSIFRAMFPRRLMESTGNAVLRTSLNALQSTFLKGLAQDFEKWAADGEYRKTREEAGGKKEAVKASAA